MSKVKEHENRATFSGNLGWEPELRDARGTPVLNLRLASNRRVKRGDEWTANTVWVNVPIFGRRAEGLARVLHKGDMVLVSGPVELREYTAKGEKRTDLECYADKVVLCGGRRNSDRNDQPPPPAADGFGGDDDDFGF